MVGRIFTSCIIFTGVLISILNPSRNPNPDPNPFYQFNLGLREVLVFSHRFYYYFADNIVF